MPQAYQSEAISLFPHKKRPVTCQQLRNRIVSEQIIGNRFTILYNHIRGKLQLQEPDVQQLVGQLVPIW